MGENSLFFGFFKYLSGIIAPNSGSKWSMLHAKCKFLHFLTFSASFTLQELASEAIIDIGIFNQEETEKTMALPGAFKAQKKDGTIYYRSSFTYKNKHISLGSFPTEVEANLAYTEALAITGSCKCECTSEDYHSHCRVLSFDKYVILLNFRDKGIYIKTPIYMMKNYFMYFLSENEALKFNVDDLFYYSNHTIIRRQGYLFVADYGMQVNILSRYGIRSHAVKGRDYEFINGDDSDYRYDNIRIINRYHGVEAIKKNGRVSYRSRIHINGNYIIGRYSSENEAAIAYNKAVAMLHDKGCTKAYPENYLEDISAIEYAKLYNSVKLSKRFRDYVSTYC